MAQPHVAFMYCLYLAKLNPVLLISDLGQLVEHWYDNQEIAESSPLHATIFLPTIFDCLHTSLQVDTHNKKE